MLLLALLQGLWLSSEYKSVANTFQRENNLLFRTTIYQLTDSLVYNRFKIIAQVDSTLNASQQIRIIDLKMNDTISDSNIQNWLGDSIRRFSDIRQLLYSVSHVFSEELLARQYRRALINNNKDIPFKIISKEMGWTPGSERMRFASRDTIKFTTSYFHLGEKAYAARFEKVNAILFKKLLPQIGISTFISLIILMSFIMVYRGLRSQQRLNEMKNNFISNMTHELKTPVSTVGVALEAMRNFDVLSDTAKTHQYLDMATQELKRLGMMTDKILRTTLHDYTKEIKLNKDLVDLKLVAEKVATSFRVLAERNHTSLIIEQSGDVTISGNVDHLTQMIYNLIDNAVKYAASSPEIIIKLSGLNDHVLLSVIDHGAGIPDEHHKRIFEKFYRVPSGDVHTVKGYGLGLHYVKGVVESHGGKITVESRAGEGCQFIIKLPKNG